ncbi:hypothetical protein [Cohnella fermenti]|uniref:hypothetical protein n=1 Tax=Cohnella fermenti TaxID=2565925 RepID=UPI0010A4C302|nr:hypothetical protein [Cohnella fermenti]
MAIAKEFADHFKVRRSYIPDFCRLIQTSKWWNTLNLEAKLAVWAKGFGSVSGRKGIIDLVIKAFRSCSDDKEIAGLRGAMVESLVIASRGGSDILDLPAFGWGARITVKTRVAAKELKYICVAPTHAESSRTESGEVCRNRSTVDFGSWNGKHAQLYECKAQPARIGCKEVKYMQYVKSEMSALDISHELFFVCADSRESIEARLEDLGLGPLFKALGARELAAMMPA